MGDLVTSPSNRHSLPPYALLFASFFVTIGLVRMSDDKIKINSTRSSSGLLFKRRSVSVVKGLTSRWPLILLCFRAQILVLVWTFSLALLEVSSLVPSSLFRRSWS